MTRQPQEASVKNLHRPALQEVCANTVKNAILFHFRFDKNYAYVATECWDCDVVASDGSNLVDVEVKISWADYKKEFKKSKYQDWRTMLDEKLRGDIMLSDAGDPNRSYFAAPGELAERIAADPEHKKYGHGVISIDRWGQCKVISKATILHKAVISNNSLRYIVMRLTSELIAMRQRQRGIVIDT